MQVSHPGCDAVRVVAGGHDGRVVGLVPLGFVLEGWDVAVSVWRRVVLYQSIHSMVAISAAERVRPPNRVLTRN